MADYQVAKFNFLLNLSKCGDKIIKALKTCLTLAPIVSRAMYVAPSMPSDIAACTDTGDFSMQGIFQGAPPP